jgi:ribosomal protein S18 acetylase RimI-like enzyme
MRPRFRLAHPEDFNYCTRLYFAGMKAIINELSLKVDTQFNSLRQRWNVTQVRIITLNGADVGWVQSFVDDGALYLGQLFVDGPFQNRGIGTEAVKVLIEEAAQSGVALTLGVVKTNPALRLYERLGFRVTHDDEYKFYMRRECGAALM